MESPTQEDLARRASVDMEACLDGEKDTPRGLLADIAKAWIRRHEAERLRADRAESRVAELEEIIRRAHEAGVHI